jgi:hypothetical protein
MTVLRNVNGLQSEMYLVQTCEHAGINKTYSLRYTWCRPVSMQASIKLTVSKLNEVDGQENEGMTNRLQISITVFV